MPKFARNTEMKLEAGALSVNLSHHTGAAYVDLHAEDAEISVRHFPAQHEKHRDAFNVLRFTVKSHDGRQEVDIFLPPAKLTELAKALNEALES